MNDRRDPTIPCAPQPGLADAQRLLGIVRALAAELRPGAQDVSTLGIDHSLERDFGLDSLARAELLTRIEHEYGSRINEEALMAADTPRDLLSLAAHGAAAAIPATMPAVPVVQGAARTAAANRPPDSAATLMDLIDWHAASHGDELYATLQGSGDLSYGSMRAGALAVATGLARQGLAAGDRVALMLPTGRDFFDVFFGALYAGCIPVPLYPPARLSQIEDHMRRSAGILANAEAAILVTAPPAKPLLRLLRPQCAALRQILAPADLSAAGDAPSDAWRRRADDIAFLQYTSGSTGNPKGVVLTHANLLANLRAMERAAHVTAADVFVSWLPLYHDMGLIGACMGSLQVGFRLVLLSPTDFLTRPASWLWAIHQHRGTLSAAPNFAYELCASKIDEKDLAGLDLSSWRLAYNGAEPVSSETIDSFTARFARYGFDRAAMTPVYGLAECSVGLAFPPAGRGPCVDQVDRETLARQGIARAPDRSERKALKLVSSGLPLPGHQIRIADLAGHELPERSLGHVQFQGPSATTGYFRNPDATAALFDGPWLKTGDMGYIAAGELYLAGRLKDIIIRAGQHLFPQELEEAISRVSGVRKGGVAVFPATDARSGTERLVVLAETLEENDDARSQIRTEISHLAVDLMGMPVDEVLLAPPRTVLKTSSGKLRRAACRELYERGEIHGTPRAPWRQLLRIAISGASIQFARFLHQASAWLWAAWVWTVCVVFALPACLMVVLLPGRPLRRRSARASARLGLALTGLSPKIEGLPELGRSAPVVIVANHASYTDVILLTAVLPPHFTFVAKQELQRSQPLALLLGRLGCAFVERFDPARGVEDTSALEKRIIGGESLVFFPEGTFRREPGLMPFRLGAFRCAARARAPVIPIALLGTRSLLRDGRWWPSHASLAFIASEAVFASGDDWQAVLRLRDAARDKIRARLQEPDAAA
ncbi:AMP-binding protein [Cupriavidus oxalaticus]|uniref:Acyl-phosphate glycerol 3-phosphate acyltransferase n=1 Tax=Cupriavidus oxalaticus TaxID=96344 RepID=A0A4P7LTE5_9BURK|nr:AMP-binding protein [Cupriavidus oxalaticus]QBY55761.1 acyl-phosphate glycerol 3-phosphate acyltransferase [Cupriavidus oxalaticus]